MSALPVAPEPEPVKAGDFFVSSWGYDQTNVDWYKVVGVTPSGKSVRVQEWTSTVVGERGGPQEAVVPGETPAMYWDHSKVDQDADEFTRRSQRVQREAPIETKRLRLAGEGGRSTAWFTVNSYSAAQLWDGSPDSRTGAGWGH